MVYPLHPSQEQPLLGADSFRASRTTGLWRMVRLAAKAAAFSVTTGAALDESSSFAEAAAAFSATTGAALGGSFSFAEAGTSQLAPRSAAAASTTTFRGLVIMIRVATSLRFVDRIFPRTRAPFGLGWNSEPHPSHRAAATATATSASAAAPAAVTATRSNDAIMLRSSGGLGPGTRGRLTA